jgi:hypothetical protein
MRGGTRHRVSAALIGLVLLPPVAARGQTPAASGFTARVTGGACASWDFVGTDVPGRRFYVPCGDHVAAFDLDRAAPAGTIAGFTGASAIAVASALHRAFVNDGGGLTVFDTRSGKVLRSIPGAGGDGIAYDPETGRVFPFGDTVHVIDAVSLREVGRVTLGHSKPESGVADGAGRILVALERANAVAVIDAHTLAVTRWSLDSACELPKTLSIDTAYHRVLVGCAKSGTVVSIDAAAGHVTSTAPIAGGFMDQTGYDESLHVLVNSGYNVITIIRVAPDGALSAADTLRTSEPTRVNVGIDPVTHRAFFAVADWIDTAAPWKGGRPETFGVITLSLARYAVPGRRAGAALKPKRVAP